MKFFAVLTQLAIAALLAVLAGSAIAQPAFPTKSIRIISPYPPGGTTDQMARFIGPKLTESWGQQVIVENRAGGNTVIGSEAMVKSAPDGYTLLSILVSHVIVPNLVATPYDPVKDFAAVATIARTEPVLVVHPSVPANNLRELIALAKSRPGELNMGSAGVGSFQHLGGELFTSMAGVNIVTVQYKGGGPAMMDAVAGNVQLMFSSLVQTLSQIRGGKLKALGVGGLKRSSTLPEVPTISEAGVPGYEAVNWWGIIAPVGTPRPILARLHKEITAIQQSPEMQKRFQAEAVEAMPMEPAEFGRYIEAEIVKWAAVIKRAGIRAE